MALFSNLGEKLNHIFSKLTKKGRLTELEVKEAMREIRVALLEADVNYLVAKDFINKVSEEALGEKILNSLTPGQQVVKIVNDKLIELLGSNVSKLNISPAPPTVIMMCGLQGAGKTTFCGKLAKMLKKQGKKVLLVACDVYRPAAINQLKVVGKSAGVDVFEKGQIDPRKIVKDALAQAKSYNYDTVIIDTAGRLQINAELMSELKDLKSIANPVEILLTVDSMTGQEAVNVAEGFNNDLDITGVVLTKLDGDTRGGAALSIKSVTGKPIKFASIGEKLDDVEPFYPDRMASRILGMGDVLTLIEKAEQAISADEAKKLEEKFRKNAFTLDDYLAQMENLGKMGNINDIVGMIPGLASKMGNVQIDESVLSKNKAIIQSMTKKEREDPDSIKASARRRIAMGSGTKIQDVNTLLKQFEQSKQMMKNLNSSKLGRMLGKRFF